MLKQLSTQHRLVTFVWKLSMLVQQSKISHFFSQKNQPTQKKELFLPCSVSYSRSARFFFTSARNGRQYATETRRKETKLYSEMVLSFEFSQDYDIEETSQNIHAFVSHYSVLCSWKWQVKFLGKCECIAVGGGWKWVKYCEVWELYTRALY